MNTMNDRAATPKARRSGPYGFLTGAILGIAGLVALGTWQLDRLAEKDALIADRQAMLVQPPLDLTHLTDVPIKIAYRRVIISGYFLHEKELRIGPRSRRGTAGWQVITPLRRMDGGIVFIDRGWVPDRRKNPQSRQEGQMGGPVTLTGLVKSGGVRGAFVPDNDAAKGDWYWIDPAAMAAHLGLAGVAPYWIVANRDRDRPAGPIGSDRVAMPANNHLQYAIIWYALAASLCAFAFAYWRRASAGE
ncbi:MAG: SURF1 family protein [Proteobacteria bacterium]|nr:SURF1 family protein [Pseudomonadota bacterium]